MHIYTKTNAGHQSTSTNVNKKGAAGLHVYTPNGECCEPSIPNIFPKPSTRETDEDTEASQEDRAYYSTSVRLFASKQEAGGRPCLFPCRCRSCFRELPLTSTPGVSSPLWLSAPTPVRHFYSSPCYTHPPCRPDSAAQTRPALFGADALAAGRPAGAHTHLHGRAHAPPAPFEGLNRVLYTCRVVVQIKEAFPSDVECPCGLKINCVKCPFFAVHSVERCATVPPVCCFISTPTMPLSRSVFLSCLRPHPFPLLHCLRLSLNLRLSPTRLSAGREYSCQLIDPAEIDSWAGGSRERGR